MTTEVREQLLKQKIETQRGQEQAARPFRSRFGAVLGLGEPREARFELLGEVAGLETWRRGVFQEVVGGGARACGA